MRSKGVVYAIMPHSRGLAANREVLLATPAPSSSAPSTDALSRLGSREEDAQIRELIKRNRLLEYENEVLRRAAVYLSQAHITLPK